MHTKPTISDLKLTKWCTLNQIYIYRRKSLRCCCNLLINSYLILRYKEPMVFINRSRPYNTLRKVRFDLKGKKQKYYVLTIRSIWQWVCLKSEEWRWNVDWDSPFSVFYFYFIFLFKGEDLKPAIFVKIYT